ncbi:MAG TPA: ATP-dependent metallopeptidase FtsH/Yme1/Tma family protein, partial [Pirellulales bacterium]|nr:ATP-dependent metallopeptidase FtsH/Yme1/Tma family protein [Pirellulales bacterium]
MDNQPAGMGPAPDKQAAQRPRPTPSFMVLLLFALVIASMLYFGGESAKRTEISYGKFVEELKAGNVAEATVGSREIYGKFKPGYPKPEKEKRAEKGREEKSATGKQAPPAGKKQASAKSAAKGEGEEFVVVTSPVAGQELDGLLLKYLGENYKAREETDSLALQMLFLLGLPLLLFAGMWLMFRRARDQFMGGGILSGFNKSPAKRYESGKQRITFDDVAGLEGVKNDLTEVVEF